MAATGTVIWNQTLALSYKNYLHVKRRLASFLCMLLTPFLVVGIIMTLNYLISKYRVVDKLKNSDVTLRGNADLPEFLPKYMIPCNMLNAQVLSKYAEVNDYFKIRVWEKYIRYGLSERTNETKSEAERFLRNHPQFFGYGRHTRWPLFYYSDVEDNEELNRNLVKSIQSLGGQRLSARDSRVPDSTVYFNQFDLDLGFDAVIQQQNPRNDNDIRFNGHNYIAFRWDKNDSWSWLRIPTEGFISTMNLLNNKFVLHQVNAGAQYGVPNAQPDDTPKIVSFVSPVMDSGLAREVLDSFFGALGVLFVPLALSFGYPALLLVLASDKETRVVDLLRVNGLRYISYWISYFSVYLTMLMLSTTAFLLAMIHSAEFKPFVETSFWVLNGYLLLWNISQLTFALASARLIGSVATAAFMGYIVGTFFMLVCSGVSLGVLPGNTEMPGIALMIPQSNLVRFMYSIFFQCVDSGCPTSFNDISSEAARCLEFQIYSAILSILVSIFWDQNLNVADLPSKICSSICLKASSTQSDSHGVENASKSNQDITAKEFEAATFTRAARHKLDGTGWLSGSMFSTTSESESISSREHGIDYNKFSHQESPEALIVQGAEYTYTVSQFSIWKLLKSTVCCCSRKRGFSQIAAKKVHAVKNVSLFIEEGKTLGILGPNGSGKTTLLKLLTGNTSSQTGNIWFGGSSVGYCPQFDLLFEDLTVQEHLIFFSYFKGSSLQLIDEALEGVDLVKHSKKTPKQLSGGMKRRTSLAISLLGDCPLVVLDEPSSGLDPTQRRRFWQTLKKCTANRAVLITTHLMDEAEYLCDRIMVMVEGKNRTVGTINELRSKYCPGTRVEIFFPSDDFELRGPILENIPGVIEVEHSGKKCRLVVAETTLSQSLAGLENLREQGVINEWAISRHTMEEVFLKVVGHYREEPKTFNTPTPSTVILQSDSKGELELAEITPR